MPLFQFSVTRKRVITDHGVVTVDLGLDAEDEIDEAETFRTTWFEMGFKRLDEGLVSDLTITEPLERIMELHDMAKEGADEH